MATAFKSTPAREVQLLGIGRTELIAKGVLTLDEYRSHMSRLCAGKQSAKDLTATERGKMLALLKHLGWAPVHAAKAEPAKPGAPAKPPRRRKLDTTDAATKVRALWLFLHVLGEVKDPSEAALGDYVKRMAGVDDLHWTNGEQLGRLTESLKKWAMRPLVPAVQALRNDLVAAGESVQPQHWINASKAIADIDGRMTFDPWWRAWCALAVALDKPDAAEMQAVGLAAADQP
ncbi:phage protein GemA/Gp16 family protein [Ideonella sp.]|uniref:phage protein GemA/Gp16 family protein n=1 Tax=Ideonella sp. TaxID=1929293 RepID=UPI003BB58C03